MKNRKSPKLNAADFAVVSSLAALLMDMNNRNDINAGGYSVPDREAKLNPGTYRHISNAISAFVLNQTGLDISNEDWNMGGNESFGHDIQAAIYDAYERAQDEERDEMCAANPDHDLTFAQVSRYCTENGLRISREPNGEDYCVRTRDEAANIIAVSSSLLECLCEAQRVVLCRLQGRAFVSVFSA